MFILTRTDTLINTDYLKEIYRIENAIYAHAEGRNEAVLLNCFGSAQECERAFNMLIGTMKAQKVIMF